MDTSRKPFLTVDEQIHKYLKRNSYLQKVFAMFKTGGAPIETIRKYIENQGR